MTPELRIAQLNARNPDALRLAHLSGFAVLLEPLLLRTLRQQFIPGSDPSAEIDLWHSRLVQSRSTTAAVFDIGVLARLRESLTQDARREEALAVTRECFRDHPPLHRLEIELNALPVVDPHVQDADIEKGLEPLIAELSLGGDAAQRVARWLLQAAPRWHERVRSTGAAWAALIAASAVLNGRRIIEGAPPKEVSGALLARALPPTVSGTRKLGLVRTESHLRFTAADVPEVTTIDVPSYSPLLMLLEAADETPLVIDVKVDVEVPVRGDSPVTLRSLLGDTWRIDYVPPADTATGSPNADIPPPEPAQQEADQEVVSGPSPTGAGLEVETRKVLVMIGGGRRDYFNAIADTLLREGYLALMPEHYMGDPKAMPAISKMLSEIHFVVMDASLPDRWMNTWFQVLYGESMTGKSQIPVIGILANNQTLSRNWPSGKDYPWLLPRPLRFEDASELAKIAFEQIARQAEARRKELLARSEATPTQLRVFLASSSDASAFREIAFRTLVHMPLVTVVEEFPSNRQLALQNLSEQISHCDVFVLLVREFSLYTGEDYELARGLGKAILAFRIQQLGAVQQLPEEEWRILSEFHDRLNKEVNWISIRGPEELAPRLTQAISRLLPEGARNPQPAEPEQRSDKTQPGDPIEQTTPKSPARKLLTSRKFEDLREEYQRWFDRCEVRPAFAKKLVDRVERLWEGQRHYQEVEKQIGVPWIFVGILHGLEAAYKFNCHLHNGDPLTARTVTVPKGRPASGKPPFTWVDSAVDALRLQKLDQVKDWSVPHMLYLFEKHNGFGYRRRGMPSPYLWSSSNLYDKGSFGAGGFKPDALSNQCGAALMLKSMLEKA